MLIAPVAFLTLLSAWKTLLLLWWLINRLLFCWDYWQSMTFRMKRQQVPLAISYIYFLLLVNIRKGQHWIRHQYSGSLRLAKHLQIAWQRLVLNFFTCVQTWGKWMYFSVHEESIAKCQQGQKTIIFFSDTKGWKNIKKYKLSQHAQNFGKLCKACPLLCSTETWSGYLRLLWVSDIHGFQHCECNSSI